MKIPKNENSMVSHIFDGVECYITTRNTTNGKFSLYKIVNGNDYEKLINSAILMANQIGLILELLKQ